MSSYIPVPVENDPTALSAEAFDYLAAKVPGWLPAPGNLEAWLIEALDQIAAELRTLVGLVPDSIFAYYGASILGLPPYAAVQASATTTWTMIDAAGYTVQPGTVVAVNPPASSDSYAFSVVNGFAVAAGDTVAAGIEVRALEAGAAASGLTGTVQVIDPLDFVASVTLDAPTSGGIDAETTDAYLSRLSALLTLLSPRPILPPDFAILAQRSVAGVARAVAIDLYNPGPPVNANCPRCVTVAVVDADGNAVAAGVKAEVDALLQSQREVNFLAFVVDPAYTTIDVTVGVSAFPPYDAADVSARVEAAIIRYLSPGLWGVPPYGDTSGRTWLNATEVRYLEVASVVNAVDGVDFITALTIGVHGGAMGQADVPMGGVAPLPQPGTITATAVVEA